jgi:hypothetical protein
MTEAIIAGSVLVEDGTYLPDSLSLESPSSSNGWGQVKDVLSTFENAVQKAGWTFFFMAGETKATVFGFDRQKTLSAAVKQLTTKARVQHCNSIEITRIMRKSFLKVPYVCVTAHTRHLQRGLAFSG